MDTQDKMLEGQSLPPQTPSHNSTQNPSPPTTQGHHTSIVTDFLNGMPNIPTLTNNVQIQPEVPSFSGQNYKQL
jgi:hypothetical protein